MTLALKRVPAIRQIPRIALIVLIAVATVGVGAPPAAQAARAARAVQAVGAAQGSGAARPVLSLTPASKDSRGHHATSAAANPSPVECFFSGGDCASADPNVTFSLVSNGDTSACSFSSTVTWGDGKTTNTSFGGGADGSLLVTFNHTYASPGTYSVGWTADVASGSCSSNSGELEFTLTGGPSMSEQGGASNPSEESTGCSGSDPVNCATGDYWHEFSDVEVPGRGVPLDFSRTYSSSRAGTSGPLGFGWTDSYLMSLSVAKSGAVTVTQEDGSTVAFTPDGAGGFTAPGRVLATLAKNANGSYTFVRDKSHVQYGFSAGGQLASEVDRNGYKTSLSYSAGKLTAVTDPAGRRLSFTYSGAHIAKVTDPMGRTWSYSYSSSGNLTKAVDPMRRTWSFTYDAHHLLLTMTDPGGGVLKNTYNAGNQVTAQTDPAGRKTTFKYTGNPAAAAGGMTTMTDPDGHVTDYQYFSLDLSVVTQGAGTAQAATTLYTYDPDTLGIASVTDPDGHVTSSTYDASGDLLTMTNALDFTTTYAYNSFSELLSKTTPGGETSTDSYDADGNLLSSTDALGGVTNYAYGDSHPGDITAVTNPDGNVSSYAYDAHGDLTSQTVTPAKGTSDTSEYVYDADGERVCAASPDATKAGVSCPAAGKPRAARTTTTVFDADGETTSVTDPDGRVTSTAYDANGDPVTETNLAGQVTTYAYNRDSQPVKVTRPGGTSLTSAYDAAGNLTSQTNAAGEVTRYTYDALSRRTSATDPLGRKTQYAYDPSGNRLTLTDPSGRVTTYAYDAANELTGVTYSDGTTSPVTYSYDADGQRISMADGTGVTTYTYDADQRMTSVTNGAGSNVSYGYDPAGLLTGLRYPNGETVTRTYDQAGQLTSEADWLGHTARFSYDATGNLVAESYPGSIKTSLSYDPASQLSSITATRASAAVASFAYARGKLGLVTSVTQKGAFTGTLSYSYSQLSQLASDKAGKYAYDKAGDLTKLPGGVTQKYNADSELTSTTRPAKSGQVTTTYGYDKQGNRVSVKTSGQAAIALTYDQAGRLTGFGTTASYSYNGDGQRMSKDVKGTTTAFTWDESPKVPLLLVAGSTFYLYGPTGEPFEQITGTTPAFLLCDQQGSVRLLTSPAGKVVGSYAYGSFGTVTKHTGTATALQFDGQYTDSESGYQYLSARYLEPATGQFITSDPLVAATGVPYAFAGADPVNAMDPSGLCWGPTCWLAAQYQSAQDSVSQLWNSVNAEISTYGRLPDYVTADFAGGPLIVGGVTITVTRDGSLFIGPQLGVGVPGFSGAVRAGWLDQLATPCASQIDGFVQGASATGSTYAPVVGGFLGPSGAETWGNEGHLGWSNFSTEVGIGAGGGRSASLTQSYSFKLPVSLGGW